MEVEEVNRIHATELQLTTLSPERHPGCTSCGWYLRCSQAVAFSVGRQAREASSSQRGYVPALSSLSTQKLFKIPSRRWWRLGAAMKRRRRGSP